MSSQTITYNFIKFETFINDKTIIIKKKLESKEQTKQLNSQRLTKTTMDAQFNTNVYHFTGEMMTNILEKFDGKVVGSDDMNMTLIMGALFGDFKPGDKVVPSHGVAVEGGKKVEAPKKKKAKKKKVEGEPKRPTTAFFYYTASIRKDVTKENPGKKVGELSQIFGQMWADLSDDDKKPFQDQNVEDKERFAKEKVIWDEKLLQQAPGAVDGA